MKIAIMKLSLQSFLLYLSFFTSIKISCNRFQSLKKLFGKNPKPFEQDISKWHDEW